MPTTSHKLDPKAVYRALDNPNTMGTVLQVILISAYGDDIYTVDPVELFLRLEDDFGIKPCEEAESRINAILMATSTDLFYEDPQAFTGICETLVNGDPGIDVIEPLTIPEIMWGVYEVELNHGHGDFRPHVEKLIQASIMEEANEVSEEDGDITPFDYLQRYMSAMRERLYDQLEAVGILRPPLPPIKPILNEAAATLQ